MGQAHRRAHNPGGSGRKSAAATVGASKNVSDVRLVVVSPFARGGRLIRQKRQASAERPQPCGHLGIHLSEVFQHRIVSCFDHGAVVRVAEQRRVDAANRECPEQRQHTQGAVGLAAARCKTWAHAAAAVVQNVEAAAEQHVLHAFWPEASVHRSLQAQGHAQRLCLLVDQLNVAAGVAAAALVATSNVPDAWSASNLQVSSVVVGVKHHGYLHCLDVFGGGPATNLPARKGPLAARGRHRSDGAPNATHGGHQG
mmetsp:Transcript_7497/g.27539  ORF Transcript_7497/g.27539 Transcript_7497/m.27539 type:complete len:255 (-) Transcript_7497:25-789(-)